MAKKAIKELGIFKFGDISELGNILRKDASLVGFGTSLIYNSMRLIVQQSYSMQTATYFAEYTQFNPRYHTNKDTLKDISEKYPSFNVEEEFDKTFARLINVLIFTNMSAMGVTNLSLSDYGTNYLVSIIKDYKFIEPYLEKYCHATQIVALKERMVEACYFIYKTILRNLTTQDTKFGSIEYEVFDLVPFFEEIVEKVHGSENHMAHVIFAIKKCHEVLTIAPSMATIGEHLYWGGQAKIYDELDARTAYETAVKVGSISAKMQMKNAFLISKNNANQNMKTALEWDAKAISSKYSLGTLGGPYDLVDLFISCTNNAGDLSETIREYIYEKVLCCDLGYPKFAVQVIEELKYDATKENPKIDFNQLKLSQEALDGWRDYVCKYFPFLKNRMLTHKDISAECALLTLCGDLGSPYATITLNHEANKEIYFKQLAPVCITLDKLINPKTMPYYLMTDNWFRYAQDFDSTDCHIPKNAIRIITYVDELFSLFEELEVHIQSIIDKGDIPSIELTGVAVNFTQYLLYLSKNINDLDKAFDRHVHREACQRIYDFWSKRSAFDLNAVSISKLSDFIPGRPNKFLIAFLKSGDVVQRFSRRVNVLFNIITPHYFLDSLAEFTPHFDSPLGVIYAIYLNYIEKTLYAAMKEQNHVECLNVNAYCQYLHSLICMHSNVFNDISETVKKTPHEKKNVGHLDRQGKSKAMSAHQHFIDETRKYLANTKQLEECILELKHLVIRGSAYAAQIYHSISVSKLTGREVFLPFDSSLLQACMSILSQRPMIDFLTQKEFLISRPYMGLALFLFDHDNEVYAADEKVREYLLRTLVHYGDIFAVAYDAYTAAINPEKISMIGNSFHDSIEHLKSVTATNKTLIQLLESTSRSEYSYKFLHMKQKYKIQDIPEKEWINAFLLSPSADFLSE